MTESVRFSGGNNIAIKTPPHEFDATVRFYRDILSFTQVETTDRSAAFDFGALTLWVDKVDGISQAEVWLEIHTPDSSSAKAFLADHRVVARNEIEDLPSGFRGFWISSPGNIIHLVSQTGDREE